MEKVLTRYKNKKIFVGLSGGVDSSVTAHMLQKAGADVTGVFIKGWYPEGMPCTWASDRKDAMAVAAQLHIPFVTLDASREYKKAVIDYLLHEYRAGRTPNPDIMCNRDVKFGAFFDFAMRHGADVVATGHYATVHEGVLSRGKDEAKDQSYFLWAVPKETLRHVVFPLGALHKKDVRAYAKKHHLLVAEKRDSQGICFLGNVSVEEFLTKEFGTQEGHALLEDGTRVGKHNGALLHTLGERIALTDAPPGPWYVISKDVEQNTLTVAPSPRKETTQSRLKLREINSLEIPKKDEIVEAQYRYHGPRIAGTWETTSETFVPSQSITEPVASGQSLVLYRGEQCLLGGIIE